MNSSEDNHDRIKAACVQLELAIQNFEDNTESNRRAKEEAQRLKEIKSRLVEIKKQLDELSL